MKRCPHRDRVCFWCCEIVDADIDVLIIVEGDDATKLLASALQGFQALGPSALPTLPY